MTKPTEKQSELPETIPHIVDQIILGVGREKGISLIEEYVNTATQKAYDKGFLAGYRKDASEAGEQTVMIWANRDEELEKARNDERNKIHASIQLALNEYYGSLSQDKGK